MRQNRIVKENNRQFLQQVEKERILTFLPSLCLCSPSPVLTSFFLFLPHCHPLSPMTDEPWSNCILLVLVLSFFLLFLSVLALCGARARAATARYCFVHCCLGLALALARIMSSYSCSWFCSCFVFCPALFVLDSVLLLSCLGLVFRFTCLVRRLILLRQRCSI